MICSPCREKKHKYCVNIMIDRIVKRSEPIRSCACQHKASWNFSVSKNEGSNGDSTKS
jgi:hypothetical protein